MNIKTFSLVFAAFSSLAMAACTVTFTNGSGGAGGDGTGATGPGPASSSSGGGTGGMGTGGTGGTGGSAPCKTCGEFVTDSNGGSICSGSTAIYEALNTCACDAASQCATDCAGGGMTCSVYDTMETQACLDCIQANCSTEFDTCANDLP